MVVSRYTAHAELRYGLRFRASSQGARGGRCMPQGQQPKQNTPPPFLRRKDSRAPIMIRPRQPIHLHGQQANHWPPNHPPRPPVHQSLKDFIASLEDIICLLFGRSSTALPPGKAAHFPCLQSIQLFNPNLHILCVLSAYVSAMVCV